LAISFFIQDVIVELPRSDAFEEELEHLPGGFENTPGVGLRFVNGRL
jgi:hypothetical protein